MPLARYAVYRSGPQIWVAPTADDSDGWLASMRHVAIESGAFVVSVPSTSHARPSRRTFRWSFPTREVFGRGGAAIIEPTEGEVIAGPLYDEEGIVTADCDLRTGLHAKRWFDSVGHYSREDVLLGEIGLPRARGTGRRHRSGRIELELELPHHHLVAGLEAGPLKLGDHADLAQPSLEVIQSLGVLEVVPRDQQLDAAAR